MNQFAERKVEAALQKAGKVLLASVVKQSGNTVAVTFELCDIPYMLPQVTIPLFGPQYIRYPMQSGNKGIAIPAGTYLGGVSEQGGGIADLIPPANPSALVSLPIGNTEWEGVDGQVATTYGPEGVAIQDAGSNTTLLLTPDSITIATSTQFKVTVGSIVFTLADGMWNLTGRVGKLKDGTASASLAIIYKGWKPFVSWCNSHIHSNRNDGNNTGNATVQFNGNVTE